MKPRYWVAFIVGAVVLYPLAFGPIIMHRRAMEGHQGWPRIPSIYRPITRLAEASPTFRNVLTSYLQLWGCPVKSLWVQASTAATCTTPRSSPRRNRSSRGGFF